MVLLRGHNVNPWDLRPWEALADRYDVQVLVTGSNAFDASSLAIERVPVRALRDLLPPGRVGTFAAMAAGDRYLGLSRHLAGAAIVHTAEISDWFSAGPAALRRRLGFHLVATVWETLPFLGVYRGVRGRRNRRKVLAAADLLLPTTERARDCLLLEGADPARIRVAPPGIDASRFAPTGTPPADPPLILSPGRLVWEKGHQDVLRAVAALHKGIVRAPDGTVLRPRVLLVGAGPEGDRLRRHAAELGVGDAVDFRPNVPYDEMPAVYAAARCMVLASLGIPVWEEQFGMVLAEAMASGVPVLAAESGAIPEVVGAAGTLFRPGDWMGLARLLAAGPLTDGGPHRVRDAARVREYSVDAAAERLDAIYRDLLAAT
ncbi:MAG: glycosyltransferase family 4 protein [Actinomycetota bacterium]